MSTQNAGKAHNDAFLRDLELFCTIARQASFSVAARRMGLSPSHVSHRIARLEASLGTRLFHRTTRHVTITHDGELAFDWARRILEDVEQMRAAITGSAATPKGIVRLSASLRLGRDYLAPILSQLRQTHPQLEVWLELQDRRVDLLEENLDIDVRIGEVQEPHLVAHHIAASRRILCAAPTYLHRHGEPTCLTELTGHQCLPFRDRDQPFGVWRLHGPAGPETIKVSGAMASNHSDVVRRWAHDGHGIILASVWDVADSLTHGRLVRVLPQYAEPVDIWAVTAARASRSEKLRVCVTFLRDQLRAGPHALINEVPSRRGNAKGPP